MVLLKDASAEGGFVFATSYISRKGRDLAENAQAALLFYWHALGRQVRVEGTVERVTPDESDAIFLARPRDSRISALASRQSERLETREEIEFWQHRENRLHVRFVYRREDAGWRIDELQP
jgi:pyridoxamine 5'-phosphate oxidase